MGKETATHLEDVYSVFRVTHFPTIQALTFNLTRFCWALRQKNNLQQTWLLAPGDGNRGNKLSAKCIRDRVMLLQTGLERC